MPSHRSHARSNVDARSISKVHPRPRSESKTTPKTKRSRHTKGSDGRWVSKVKTVSTFPGVGTFTKEPKEIARILASKKVSPKGIGSGIRMVQYFINRGGKGLSPARLTKLERAKEILHEQLESRKAAKNR